MTKGKSIREEKMDDWTRALFAVHQNEFQVIFLNGLRHSLEEFGRDYGNVLGREEKELIREASRNMYLAEKMLKEVGSSVMEISTRKENDLKTEVRDRIMTVPGDWLAHESGKSYLVRLPEDGDSVWIPKAVAETEENGDLRIRIYRSFSFEKVRYEPNGERFRRLSSEKISAGELQEMIQKALSREEERYEPQAAADPAGDQDRYDLYGYGDPELSAGYEEVSDYSDMQDIQVEAGMHI